MISVIIPTYNRAHLLPLTVPSYKDQLVSEIIIIDDCSTDNTKEVCLALIKETPSIKYYRLPVNSKQVAAKNLGILRAKNEWLYFGDDDSVLVEGSILELFNVAISRNADIVGAKSLYMPDNRLSVEQYVAKMDQIIPNIAEICDLKKMRANFHYSTSTPIEVPFVQASALVKKSVAEPLKFDINFKGNCYREETDFFLRAHLKGHKIMYNSKAVQVNLPRLMSTGGAHSRSKLYWYISAISNNWYFLNKNWNSVRSVYKDFSPKEIMQAKFIWSTIWAGFNNLIKLLAK